MEVQRETEALQRVVAKTSEYVLRRAYCALPSDDDPSSGTAGLVFMSLPGMLTSVFLATWLTSSRLPRRITHIDLHRLRLRMQGRKPASYGTSTCCPNWIPRMRPQQVSKWIGFPRKTTPSRCNAAFRPSRQSWTSPWLAHLQMQRRPWHDMHQVMNHFPCPISAPVFVPVLHCIFNPRRERLCVSPFLVLVLLLSFGLVDIESLGPVGITANMGRTAWSDDIFCPCSSFLPPRYPLFECRLCTHKLNAFQPQKKYPHIHP